MQMTHTYGLHANGTERMNAISKGRCADVRKYGMLYDCMHIYMAAAL